MCLNLLVTHYSSTVNFHQLSSMWGHSVPSSLLLWMKLNFFYLLISLLPHFPMSIGLHSSPFVNFSKYNLLCHSFSLSNLRFQKSPALYCKFLLSISFSPTWINRSRYWLVSMINLLHASLFMLMLMHWLCLMPHCYVL